MRRATNASTSQVSGSSQCASSTASRSGAAAAASASSSSAASAMRKRSGALPLPAPNAEDSAAAWGGGSSAILALYGRSSRCRPANAICVSEGAPAVRRIVISRARARARGLFEQRGLPDSRLAANEHRGTAVVEPSEQLVYDCEFVLATRQRQGALLSSAALRVPPARNSAAAT